MPRQRKFQADLAVINECLNELIETVGGRSSDGGLRGVDGGWSGPPCPVARHVAQRLFGARCWHAGPSRYAISTLPFLPRQPGGSGGAHRGQLALYRALSTSRVLLVACCLQAKATRQEEDLEALQARDYSKVRV